MAIMTLSEARASLPEVLNRVADGEEITITRHGKPAAVVVRPDVLWSRTRAELVLEQAHHLDQLLAAAGAQELPEREGLTEQRAEELIGAIRSERSGR